MKERQRKNPKVENTTEVEKVVEVAEKKPRWKVLSGGITLLDRTSYTKGDIFEAWDHEVPTGFRDILQCLDTVDARPAKAKMVYSLQEVVPTAEEEDDDDYVQLYKIVNENGKEIVSTPLAKEVVEPLLKELNK